MLALMADPSSETDGRGLEYGKIASEGEPPAPQPLGSGRRNDRRRRWRMTLARNRKFADSPVERNGFEIPVPGFRSNIFYTAPELGAATRGPASLARFWPRRFGERG